MKIAVLVKRVPDTASVFKVADSGNAVETGNLKYVMSPYDEHAVEEAIKLQEAGIAEQVTIISVGDDAAKETMRTALAMGADEGFLVTVPADKPLSPRGTSKLLAKAVEATGATLVLAGKQAVDDDAAQVPERVAALLGWASASVVTKMDVSGDQITLDREIEGGHYTLKIATPAVVSIQKGINTPRYPKLPNIMKAKKKPLVEKSPQELGVADADLTPGTVVTQMSLPRTERLQKILEGDTAEKVNELVRILREDEKVL